ncbi:MAG: DUF5004 domain-containing protein [Breznakibacter sp.]
MKKTAIYALLFFAALQLGGCELTDDGSYVAPVTVYEKVNGTWALTKLSMVDNYAISNAIEPTEQEITYWFNFETLTITLNVDPENNPTTYSVSGDVPELFLKEGYWSLNSPFTRTDQSPLVINLYQNASKDRVADQLVLSSIPSGGASNGMEFKLVRQSNGLSFLTYVFKLSPVTQN